jgi:hypothetical protein
LAAIFASHALTQPLAIFVIKEAGSLVLPWVSMKSLRPMEKQQNFLTWHKSREIAVRSAKDHLSGL